MLVLNQLLERCHFPNADHVFCAVSGGPDSLALLALACASGRAVTAIHVDHGLRSTSAEDADVVAQATLRFGAEFISEKVRVESGPNLEARARAARYAVMPPDVLTGHTADDQAETVLLNLVRGSGLAGLGGMSIERKPLLNLRRAETHALCDELGLAPVHDETNDSMDIRRNRVRHELLPLLDAIAQRDVAAVIARQTEHLREDEEMLQSLAGALDPTDAKQLAAAPVSLARRAIRNWLRTELDDEHHPPSAAAVDRVLQVASGSAVACDISGGFSVRRSEQHLFLENKTSNSF